MLGGAEPTPEVRDTVAELREGLSSAYRQLRELLTTFRLKMEHPRLEDSLRDTVEEFASVAGCLLNWTAPAGSARSVPTSRFTSCRSCGKP